MKKLLFLLLLAGPLLLRAQSLRQHSDFDSDWKFHLGHATKPEDDFNYSISNLFSKTGVARNTAINPRFNDSAWRTLDLPHDWAVELPFVFSSNFDVMAHGYKPVGGLYPETSVGWYRKHFTVSSKDSGARFELQFDGIFRDANIWVNGFFLGNIKSGYIGASYDITDYLSFDRDNVVVARVDATQYEGWFYEGAGIYRHVWLNKYSAVHLSPDDFFFSSATAGNKTNINVEAAVMNQAGTPARLSLVFYLADRNGNRLAQSAEQTLSAAAVGVNRVKTSFSFSGARRWSLEDPYLYRIVSVLKQNGRVIDSLCRRVGIRDIEIRTTGVFLNGQHVKLQGVCCHQDHGGLGVALPDYIQYYRIYALKNMGVTAYRSSHNPPTPELLDACDSLGMLVLDENRLLNSSPEYTGQLERLIRRDRNHPCVFMWSIGNEEWAAQGESTGKRIAQTLIQLQREFDPTRTCTYAADNGNWYRGVNEVIPVRGFNYRHNQVEEYHAAHPNQPLMGTEMGSTVTTRGIYEKDTIRCYVPDQDITFPWWASTAEAWWKLAGPADYWLGGFVWTGFDYRGEPTPYQWPNINSHFGIMDMCGFPKNIYYYYQSWWTNKDILHISPHWNFKEKQAGWNKKQGDPVEVWVNSNADDVELFLNGRSQGKKSMPRNGHLNWTVNYEQGKLEAVATKNGKTFSEKVETTGLPVDVVVTPYKTTMLADGKDAAVVNISVADGQGRMVPDADNLIRFSLEGDGRIIGVCNGDPSSQEPDKCAEGAWQRSLFNGKCQVILQSGNSPGMLKFTARAAGLWSGGTDIQTVDPRNVAKISHDRNYTVTTGPRKEVDKMLGADISFLPELEARGMKFFDGSQEIDAIQLLKDHGFNYVRLRIFNDPARDSGYSPGKGFCDLSHTLQMAKRVKAAGMKLLLDFHYSDYWADPGKQYKPAAWRNLSFEQLKQAMYDYTRDVIRQLKEQGTTPDMVQVGNEINHGLLWPEGNVANIDNLAQLISAGTSAVKSVDPSISMLLHIALGGQHDESVFFLDQMLARGVYFDVIGESYYPRWHGTLDDLRDNLNDLARRYDKDVIVVEYSQHKEEVNRVAFEVAGGKGKGTCIWEPLSTWEKIVDNDGKANAWLGLYDELSRKYLVK